MDRSRQNDQVDGLYVALPSCFGWKDNVPDVPQCSASEEMDSQSFSTRFNLMKMVNGDISSAELCPDDMVCRPTSTDAHYREMCNEVGNPEPDSSSIIHDDPMEPASDTTEVSQAQQCRFLQTSSSKSEMSRTIFFLMDGVRKYLRNKETTFPYHKQKRSDHEYSKPASSSITTMTNCNSERTYPYSKECRQNYSPDTVKQMEHIKDVDSTGEAVESTSTVEAASSSLRMETNCGPEADKQTKECIEIDQPTREAAEPISTVDLGNARSSAVLSEHVPSPSCQIVVEETPEMEQGIPLRVSPSTSPTIPDNLIQEGVRKSVRNNVTASPRHKRTRSDHDYSKHASPGFTTMNSRNSERSYSKDLRLNCSPNTVKQMMYIKDVDSTREAVESASSSLRMETNNCNSMRTCLKASRQSYRPGAENQMKECIEIAQPTREAVESTSTVDVGNARSSAVLSEHVPSPSCEIVVEETPEMEQGIPLQMSPSTSSKIPDNLIQAEIPSLNREPAFEPIPASRGVALDESSSKNVDDPPRDVQLSTTTADIVSNDLTPLRIVSTWSLSQNDFHRIDNDVHVPSVHCAEVQIRRMDMERSSQVNDRSNTEVQSRMKSTPATIHARDSVLSDQLKRLRFPDEIMVHVWKSLCESFQRPRTMDCSSFADHNGRAS